MIPEENLNMPTVNDGAPASTNNADVSHQISSIKQVGGEKIKEVVGNYKNLQKLPKLKRVLYITIPIIIATIIVFIGMVKFDEATSDGFYIEAANRWLVKIFVLLPLHNFQMWKLLIKMNMVEQ